jgi:anti-sigma regulatory factor (Ser/Thr protein kinase)
METSFRVPARAPGPGLDALEAALREAAVPEEVVLELRLAAEELILNVASHGHDDAAEALVDVQLGVSAGEVTLRFADDGRGFDPLAAPPPDLAAPAEERPIGGLGIHLVRSLVDSADYARTEGRNVLTLRRRVRRGQDGVP